MSTTQHPIPEDQNRHVSDLENQIRHLSYLIDLLRTEVAALNREKIIRQKEISEVCLELDMLKAKNAQFRAEIERSNIRSLFKLWDE